MTQTIEFASTCPSCKRKWPQYSFTVRALVRLLYAEYPIEAYCVACDEFWSISSEERTELCEAVLTACGGAPPSRSEGLKFD